MTHSVFLQGLCSGGRLVNLMATGPSTRRRRAPSAVSAPSLGWDRCCSQPPALLILAVGDAGTAHFLAPRCAFSLCAEGVSTLGGPREPSRTQKAALASLFENGVDLEKRRCALPSEVGWRRPEGECLGRIPGVESPPFWKRARLKRHCIVSVRG